MVTKNELDDLSKQIYHLYRSRKHRSLILLLRIAEIIDELLIAEIYSTKFGRTRRTRFSVLDALIRHNGSMTSTNLSKSIFRTKHTVSRLVDKLVKDGLVTRKHMASDRRFVKITITQAGIDYVKSTMPDRQKFFSKISAGLNNQQLDTLYDILKILKKHLR